MKTKLIALSFWGLLCIQSCTNQPQQHSSNSDETRTEITKNESKTTIQLLKEDGWTEYCTVTATNPNANSIYDNLQRRFVILFKNDKYAAILSSQKYDEHSVDYSPILLTASRGTFRVRTDDGDYETYTGRVIWGDGTHFYFDF